MATSTLAEPLTTLYFSRMVPSRRKLSWMVWVKFGRCDGVGVEAVGGEPFDGEPVGGGPAVGEIPLGAGVAVAHGEAAGVLEERRDDAGSRRPG